MSIASDNGFFWETLWNWPANRELASRRNDPNVLCAGDEVEVPDLRARTEICATEQVHRFTRKGVPAKLRLRILREPDPDGEEAECESLSSAERSVTSEDPEPASAEIQDEPRRNVPFILDIDGRLIHGSTDDDGRIEVDIPPKARRGRLIVDPGTPDEIETPLELGTLDPISEIVGVSQRLANLGMGCEPTAEVTPEFEAALRAFQQKHGLEVSGEIDAATSHKLEELHDS